MKKYTADFETSTWVENETWVWAWAVAEIKENTEEVIIDNNIDSFMEFCKKEKKGGAEEEGEALWAEAGHPCWA